MKLRTIISNASEKVGLSPKAQVAKILHEEYKGADAYGKLFLAAIIINAFFWFIPYFAQIATVVLLSLFLKRYLAYTRQNGISNFTSKFTIGLTLGTMAFQAFWLEFLTSIITLMLLGVLYAFVSKEKA